MKNDWLAVMGSQLKKRSFFMKNTVKILGIIVLAIAVVFVACDNGSGKSKSAVRPDIGTWEGQPKVDNNTLYFDLPYESAGGDLALVTIKNPSNKEFTIVNIRPDALNTLGGVSPLFFVNNNGVIDTSATAAFDNTLANGFGVPSGGNASFGISYVSLATSTAGPGDKCNTIFTIDCEYDGGSFLVPVYIFSTMVKAELNSPGVTVTTLAGGSVSLAITHAIGGITNYEYVQYKATDMTPTAFEAYLIWNPGSIGWTPCGAAITITGLDAGEEYIYFVRTAATPTYNASPYGVGQGRAGL